MHNQRNRHAAALRPLSAKTPAFPADVAVPPQHGALIRAAEPAPRRKRASLQEVELIRLRAENARLRRQMDALLAPPPRPVGKAPSPA